MAFYIDEGDLVYNLIRKNKDKHKLSMMILLVLRLLLKLVILHLL